MNTKIFSKTIKLTEGLKNTINKQADELKNKYIFNNSRTNLSVTLKIEHEQHICELIIFAPRHTFKISSSTDDTYKSINKAFAIFNREFRKHKEKFSEKRFKNIQGIEEINFKEENYFKLGEIDQFI